MGMVNGMVMREHRVMQQHRVQREQQHRVMRNF